MKNAHTNAVMCVCVCEKARLNSEQSTHSISSLQSIMRKRIPARATRGKTRRTMPTTRAPPPLLLCPRRVSSPPTSTPLPRPIHSSLVTHLPSALKLCLYVMMRRNSSSLTSPSPSMSALLGLGYGEGEGALTLTLTRTLTLTLALALTLLIISCSSSSVMFSPSSRATRLRLRKEILPG